MPEDKEEHSLLLEPSSDNVSTYSQGSPSELAALESDEGSPWFRRLFKPIQRGSMRLVLIGWLRFSVGVGVMALPFYVSQYGVLLGLVVVLAACLLSIFSFESIFEARESTSARTLPQIARFWLGPGLASAVKASLLLDQAASFLIHAVVGWDLAARALGQPEATASLGVRAAFFAIQFVALTPLFLRRKLGALGSLNSAYLASLLATVGLLGLSVVLGSKGSKGPGVEGLATQPGWQWLRYFFPTLGAFYCHAFVMNLRNELLNPTLSRLAKVVRIANSFQLVLYSTFGAGIYWALGPEETPQLAFLRDPGPGTLGLLLQVSLVAFFAFNLLTLPVYTNGIRESLSRLYPLENKDRQFSIYSLLPAFALSAIGVIYPHVVSIFVLCGSTLSYFNGFFLPFLMKEKILKKEGRNFSAALVKVGNYSLFALGWLAFALEIRHARREGNE